MAISLTLALLRRLRNQRLKIEQRLDADGRDRREVGGACAASNRRSGSNGVSQSHTMRASICEATVGGSSARESMAPRETSMSVSSCRTTACPCSASSRSRPMVAMRRTCALRPLSASVTRSPTLMLARGDGAGETAEVLAVAQHGLHGQAEGPARGDVARRDALAGARAVRARRTRACARIGARRCRRARRRPEWRSPRGSRSAASARGSRPRWRGSAPATSRRDPSC